MATGETGSAKLKGLVRLSLLDRVDPALLLRFLSPHAAYLRGRGVSLNVTPDQEWIGHLFDVLTSVDAEMPGALSRALLEVADVANAEGQEAVLQLAGQRQLTLFEGRPLSAEDTAFSVYLEQAELFRDSQSRMKSQEARNFVDFMGRPGCVLEKVDSRRHTMVTLLRDWFDQRNRTDHVEIRVEQNALETTFVVIHGQTPRSFGVILDRDRRERTNLIPDRVDVLIVHHETGRLSVNAQYPNEQDHYRKLMGVVFFEDMSFFKATEVITGAPLLEDPASALSHHGFPEIRDVRLRLAVLTSVEDPGRQQWYKDADLLEAMLSGPPCFFPEEAVVTRLELEIDLRHRKRPLIVKASTPNKLEYDRRVYDDLVREFLLVRGFIQLPRAASFKMAV